MFGQNFLLNNTVASNIIYSLGNIKNHNILEVGPGTGILTRYLLEKFLKSLVIVEIDKKIIPILRDIKSKNDTIFTIINDNAINVNEESIIHGRYSIVANLPYNISTRLIVKWIKKMHFIDKIVVMLQKEVADRIVATPSTKQYGKLSVLAQFNCDCELLFYVSPENFFPSPKVTSAVIKLKPRKSLRTAQENKNIEKICKLAFNFRRKKISNSLKGTLISFKHFFNDLNINPNKRCEQLTIDEFFRISSYLYK